jgi:predicted ferric reductase
MNLGFEGWRLLHDVISPALLTLVFVHSWRIGDHLQAASMQILWVILFGGALTVFAYHRLIRPRLLELRPYEVTEVKTEADKVWTVKLAPPGGKEVFDYLPGQFQFITLLRGRKLPREEHHFTISSSPTQRDHLSSTIKALGDFTSTIGDTRPGDRAVIHAPFGRFSYVLHPQEKELVFIAGGIGITPVMAMLRYMRDQEENIPVTLLYANPDRSSIVFYDELREIEQGGTPALKVVHVLSHPGENWTGESGYIDGEMLERYCGKGLGRKGFYLVGPPGLSRSSIRNLRAMGVSDERIHSEIFTFVD